MHYHCEIVLPPCEDVENAIASIMEPFDESPSEPNEDHDRQHAFWDWHVLGGRFAGVKAEQAYDKAKLDEFYQWCTDEKVTVSGLQCGKQELKPATQIPKVDAKWNEMFPRQDGKLVACPRFHHSNNQWAHGIEGMIEGDICRVDEALHVTCARVIFAGPSWVCGDKEGDAGSYTGPLKAEHMFCEDIWNGVNFVTTNWDGKLSTAIDMYRKHLERYKDEYRRVIEPHDDWQVATVDYHS